MIGSGSGRRFSIVLSFLFLPLLFIPICVEAQEKQHLASSKDAAVINSVVSSIESGKFKRAASQASVALRGEKIRDEDRCRLRFLRALASVRAGLASDPSDWISVISSKYGEGLRAHAAWYLGLELWKRGKKEGTKKAIDLAGPYLEKVTVPGRFGLEASSRLVRGLLASGKYRQACKLAKDVARSYYRKRTEPQALWSLASCLERAGWAMMRSGDKPGGRAYLTHGVQLYRMISVMWSEHWVAPMAKGSLARLTKAGIKPGQMPAGLLLDRARDLVEHRRFTKDMLRLWRIKKLMARGVKDPAGAELELLWATMSLSRRRFRAAWAAASRILRRAKDEDIKAKAALIHARIAARRNRGRAVKTYLDLVKRWPKTVAASKALYMAGELSRRGGDVISARDLFLRCVKEYGSAHRAGSCRWGLAWTYYLQDQLEPALEWLSPLFSQDDLLVNTESWLGQPEGEPGADAQTVQSEFSDSDEQKSDAEEQDTQEDEEFNSRGVRLSEMAKYWTARIHQRLSHLNRAEQLYLSVAQDSPFSYYSSMAWARLAEMDCAPALDLDPQPECEPDSLSPEVAAAVSYFKMGLPGEARATLAPLNRYDFDSPQDRRWAAWVHERLGNFVRSHRMAPVPMQGGLPDYPVQGWKFDASLAFPRAFSQYVQGNDKAESVPASLMYSIIRAESGFWPRAHSAAHARGLTQVISRTAWSMARKLKIKRFRRWRLYDPQVSIRVGSEYLSRLLARYDNPVLAIAAYNAGEPSVDKWLRRRGQMQLDEFIEEIPYTETSRYTRKVVSWWAIYRVLYNDEVKQPLDVDFSLHSAENKK